MEEYPPVPAGASRGRCSSPLPETFLSGGRTLAVMRPVPPVHGHSPLRNHGPAVILGRCGLGGSPEVVHAVGVLEGAYNPIAAAYRSLKNCLRDFLGGNFCVSYWYV